LSWYDDGMNKKTISLIIVALGLSLILYGYINAPVTNETEITTKYRCARLTLDALPTDVYCSDPSSAPEANIQIPNPLIYSGLALALVGAMYVVTTRTQQKKKS
jgi:hypothetical protein